MTEPASGAESEDDGEPLAAPKRSTWRVLAGGLSPRSVWAMAGGYPVVLKQFIQFCLILVYPAWVVGVLAAMAVYGLFYVTVYPVLWVLFWPMRAWMKKNRPEEYAQSQRKK
ncbi:hypothetical protein BST22_20185 [Mycolicibacterium chubuense]|uniref:Uncharacterized protein n=1 Tax=Mycolicibacterium chubuense TaxID=1800 RepID=A0A0J6WEJ6_MYCCU|nr:hypothetical protein [Mycolicibacterium chubuense]KMO80939.1 hypothetical protein MCHUDSM44219_01989 [Mycolicibacterium chubuense]ORA47292.1 hypothetical protein BST22_20185 [Mycolicibacterium chubuense]SPY00840.1 Uncharacterised protein [Mycolicibacterium chubuense]